MFDLTCLTMKDPPNNKTWNCKDIDNYRCGSLDQVFMVGRLAMASSPSICIIAMFSV